MRIILRGLLESSGWYDDGICRKWVRSPANLRVYQQLVLGEQG